MALSWRWNLRLSGVKEGKMFMTLERGHVISSFSTIMVPNLVDHFNPARPNPLFHFPCTAADTESKKKELYLQNPTTLHRNFPYCSIPYLECNTFYRYHYCHCYCDTSNFIITGREYNGIESSITSELYLNMFLLLHKTLFPF